MTSETPADPSHPTRLDVLDGLRGIAVLLVLWYHVWEISWKPSPSWLQFLPETGFIGVPLFFFLSGFVITYPFARWQWAGAKQPSWGDFTWRRFIKIVPSYALSIVVAYSIGYAAQQQGNASIFQDVVTHLLFVHTWFDQSFGSINGVLWTLAVEVEFYVCFPLIWWCFRRTPWVTVASMIAAALLWRNGLFHCCNYGRFAQWEENLPGYIDIFACGMIACYIFTRWGTQWMRAARTRALATVVAIAGFAWLWLLLRSLYAYRSHDQWAGIWLIDNRTLLGLSFLVIALGSLLGASWWRRVIANPVLVFFATISYTLYLYHQIVARELLWHNLPRPATVDPHSDPHWQTTYTWLAVVVATAQATLFTYAFERPILRLKGHLTKRGAQRSTRDIAG